MFVQSSARIAPPFKEDRWYDLIMSSKLLRDMKPKKHARYKPHPSAYHKDYELLFEEGTLNKRELRCPSGSVCVFTVVIG